MYDYDYCKYHQRLIGVHQKAENSHPLLQGLHNLFTVIGLKAFWQKTFYGLKTQVEELCMHGQQIEALQLLIERLNRQHFWLNHAVKWWVLMRLSIQIAQDLPKSTLNRVSDPIQHLFKLGGYAPMPWRGEDVAYSFVALSLWSFELGKTQKAIEQVNSAIHADISWGYPEYLLGCYGLLLEGIEPVTHFVKAVELNWNFLERLKQDPLCQQFPDVIQAVTACILAKQNGESMFSKNEI
ncbi:MAG: hypothetical protein JSS07_07895 [Proteobacteria bacterium]|nr:hypothetical protein [Pseudomonadota bacterium]